MLDVCDTVQHLVKSPVAAESDYFSAVLGQRRREFRRVPRLIGDVQRVGNIPFQTVFRDLAHVFHSAALAAFQISDYIQHWHYPV